MSLRIILSAILLALTVVEFYLPKEKSCPSFWHSSPARTICMATIATLFGFVLCLFLVGK